MNYDTWKTGDYGNEFWENPKRCYDCDQFEEDKFRAKEYFEDVLKILYSKDKMDLVNLENSLDEVAGYFGIKLPIEILEISRSKIISPYVAQWVAESKNYMKSLAK